MPRYIIQTREIGNSFEWEVIDLIAEGTSSNAPDGYLEASEALAKHMEMASSIPGPMAPNPNPEMVPTPLTPSQRQDLYHIVYCIQQTEYEGDTDLLPGYKNTKYHELLAALSK